MWGKKRTASVYESWLWDLVRISLKAMLTVVFASVDDTWQKSNSHYAVMLPAPQDIPFRTGTTGSKECYLGNSTEAEDFFGLEHGHVLHALGNTF